VKLPVREEKETRMISRLLGVLLLLFSVHVEALPIYPYTGEVSPILGATVVATGGDVIAT
jgi:hypothetical protein